MGNKIEQVNVIISLFYFLPILFSLKILSCICNILLKNISISARGRELGRYITTTIIGLL